MTEARKEIGYAKSASSDRAIEDNWDLTFPRSVAVYAKMLREDAQIKSVFNAMTLPIRRSTWRLDPNGADPEVVAHVAGDLGLPVLGDDSDYPVRPYKNRVSWDKHLQAALLSLPFGFMFFEQTYEVSKDGKEHLRKLAPRYPATIDEIKVDDDGGLVEIGQKALAVKPGARAKQVRIPVSQLVAYVYDETNASWLGTSILRPAYKHWMLRDQLLRLELSTLDRNGMGIPVYTGSPYAADPKADLEAGREIAEELRAGSSSGAAIPEGASLDIKGTSGQLVSPRQAIDYHDSMIAKSVLAHFLNLEGKGGSYALAETQSDLFIQSLQQIGSWISAVANEHIVEDLVDLAFPEYEGTYPLIVFDPIASKKDLSATDLAALVNAGVILMDRETEDEIRRRYQLPAKKPLEEALVEKAEAEQRAKKIAENKTDEGESSDDGDQETN